MNRSGPFGLFYGSLWGCLLLVTACSGDMAKQTNVRPFDDDRYFWEWAPTVQFPEGVEPRLSYNKVDHRGPRQRLHEGKQGYEAFCMPCHGMIGFGDGPIVQRGFPKPPSFHENRLKAASDDHFINVIAQGFGRMYSYADRVPEDLRQDITDYIRVLQLSQNMPLQDLPREIQQRMNHEN